MKAKGCSSLRRFRNQEKNYLLLVPFSAAAITPYPLPLLQIKTEPVQHHYDYDITVLHILLFVSTPRCGGGSETYIECLKQQQFFGALCLPPTSSRLLFPLHSDEILLFRHTVWLPVWLQLLWHKTHLLYLTEMPNAAVRDDWQVHAPVSATCRSARLISAPLCSL